MERPSLSEFAYLMVAPFLAYCFCICRRRQQPAARVDASNEVELGREAPVAAAAAAPGTAVQPRLARLSATGLDALERRSPRLFGPRNSPGQPYVVGPRLSPAARARLGDVEAPPVSLQLGAQVSSVFFHHDPSRLNAIYGSDCLVIG